MVRAETVRYTVQHLVHVTASRCASEEGLVLFGISSTDPAEDIELGEDGPYSCWDADVNHVRSSHEVGILKRNKI